MIKNYNAYKVLSVFFRQPTKKFHKRDISRVLDLGLPSVSNYLEILEKEGFVTRNKDGLYETYTGSFNDLFKLYKTAYNLVSIHKSGLIDFLIKEFTPNCVILFGSSSRGEDIETSDMDIFMVAGQKEVDLQRFEDALGRKISIHAIDDFSSLSKELKNNILNGIKLYGYIEAFI
jgi:predicted nucleotidyltransferase